MSKVSVLIPSRNEQFLPQTVADIFAKAAGDVEVIVFLDGYWPDPIPEDQPNLAIIHSTQPKGMRGGVKAAAAIAKGEYLMKIDAHCMFDQGFDKKLLGTMQDNWVVIPTRKRLDPEKWEVIQDGRPDINYMYLDENNRGKLDEAKNSDPSLESERLVETNAFQGSCWFMRKDYFEKLGLEDDENFGGSGHEAQEIYYKVHADGGKIIRNKNTWYAHWHKPFGSAKPGQAKSREYLKTFLQDPQRGEMDLSKWIIDKYGLDDSESPILIPGMGRRQMYELFAELGLNSGCEVGVQRGRNAWRMFQTIPNLHLFLVDPYRNHNFGDRRWDERDNQKFKKQTAARLKDNWVIQYLYDFGENTFNEIPDNSLDFVYIDGDHSYEFVMLDILLFRRKVKRGGIISGHDYFYKNSRQARLAKVTAAVDDYTRRHGIKPFFVTDKTHVEEKGDRCASWFWVNDGFPSTNLEKRVDKVGIVQYTDNSGDPLFMEKCRQQIKKCAEINGIDEIVCVSQEPIEDFGRNIVMELERSVLSIFKQVVKGLEESSADVIYLCEHDLIYHPSHFQFKPPEENIFYYDMNRWSLDDVTGKAVFYYTDVPSMMCGFKEHLLNHYSKVLEFVEKNGWRSRYGYSPPKGLPREKRTGKRQSYIAKFPSLDVRRKDAFTRKRMSQEQFRGANSHRGWTEADNVPGWDRTGGRFKEFIQSL